MKTDTLICDECYKDGQRVVLAVEHVDIRFLTQTGIELDLCEHHLNILMSNLSPTELKPIRKSQGSSTKRAKTSSTKRNSKRNAKLRHEGVSTVGTPYVTKEGDPRRTPVECKLCNDGKLWGGTTALARHIRLDHANDIADYQTYKDKFMSSKEAA